MVIKLILIFYFLFLHAVIGVTIIKTDLVSRIQVKLGYEIPKEELTPNYHRMVIMHQRVDKNLPDKSIHFIGDSLTLGLAVSAVSPLAVNFGIGKDTSFGVLNRIPFYSSISKSKLVVIAIGVNDLRVRGDDEIIDNIQNIVTLIPEDIPVLLSGIHPTSEVYTNKLGDNLRIKKINNEVKKICLQSSRLHCLDIFKSIADSKGNLSSKFHIGDGVHLNSAGNSIWISKLEVAVKNIINQP